MPFKILGFSRDNRCLERRLACFSCLSRIQLRESAWSGCKYGRI